MIKHLVLLAAVALVPGQDTDRGGIEIRFGHADSFAVVVVQPDGMMTVDRPNGPESEAGRTTKTQSVGFPGYDRIAALVKPARRWAGGKMPCDEKAFAGGGFWPTPEVSVRWLADNAKVEVPVICMRGPAQDEIELIRAAIDEVKRWTNEEAVEPVDAEPFDPAANAIYYNAITGEPDR